MLKARKVSYYAKIRYRDKLWRNRIITAKERLGGKAGKGPRGVKREFPDDMDQETAVMCALALFEEVERELGKGKAELLEIIREETLTTSIPLPAKQ